MTTVAWVLLAAALILLTVGVVSYRRSRRSDEGQTSAILSFVVGADLLVFALLSG